MARFGNGVRSAVGFEELIGADTQESGDHRVWRRGNECADDVIERAPTTDRPIHEVGHESSILDRQVCPIQRGGYHQVGESPFVLDSFDQLYR